MEEQTLTRRMRKAVHPLRISGCDVNSLFIPMTALETGGLRNSLLPVHPPRVSTAGKDSEANKHVNKGRLHHVWSLLHPEFTKLVCQIQKETHTHTRRRAKTGKMRGCLSRG